MGLTKRVTPRALRRTFNDLARAAQVQDVVTRSISGHLTEGMQRHYSTVSGDEQRQALAKVIDLTRAAAKPALRPGEEGGQQPTEVDSTGQRRWPARWTAGRGRWTAGARGGLRIARFPRHFQWAQQGLNLRLHPCEGCTLPLSYAPGEATACLPQPPPSAQARTARRGPLRIWARVRLPLGPGPCPCPLPGRLGLALLVLVLLVLAGPSASALSCSGDGFFTSGESATSSSVAGNLASGGRPKRKSRTISACSSLVTPMPGPGASLPAPGPWRGTDPARWARATRPWGGRWSPRRRSSWCRAASSAGRRSQALTHSGRRRRATLLRLGAILPSSDWPRVHRELALVVARQAVRGLGRDHVRQRVELLLLRLSSLALAASYGYSCPSQLAK